MYLARSGSMGCPMKGRPRGCMSCSIVPSSGRHPIRTAQLLQCLAPGMQVPCQHLCNALLCPLPRHLPGPHQACRRCASAVKAVLRCHPHGMASCEF